MTAAVLLHVQLIHVGGADDERGGGVLRSPLDNARRVRVLAHGACTRRRAARRSRAERVYQEKGARHNLFERRANTAASPCRRARARAAPSTPRPPASVRTPASTGSHDYRCHPAISPASDSRHHASSSRYYMLCLSSMLD
ncbi:unnamed protein product, partial [Brenthis ino]